MRLFAARVLRWLGVAYLFLAVAVMIVGYIAYIVMAPDRTAAIGIVMEEFSPYSTFKWIGRILILVPGLGLMMVADKLHGE